MSIRGKSLVKPQYPFVLNKESPQTDNLIAWWPGIGAGTILHDFSVVQNHGALLNFAVPLTNVSGWAPGIDGDKCALAFDGTNDGVEWTPAQSARVFYFAAAQPHSVSLWVKPSAGNVATAFLIGVRNAPVGPDGSGWFLYYDGTNSGLYWDYYGGTGNGTMLHQRQSSAGSVPVGKWTHICCTRDATNTIAGQKIYINGVPNTGTPTDTGPTPTNADYFTGPKFGIGKNPQATANPYKGLIEDPCIYSKALSIKEVGVKYDGLTRWNLRYILGRQSHFMLRSFAYSVGNTIAFTQSVKRVRELSVGNTIAFQQEVVTGILEEVSNTLTLTQNIQVKKVLNISVGNTVALHQAQTETSSKINVNNAISFNQTLVGGLIYHKFVSQSLSLTHIANVSHTTPARNTITFVGVATAQKTRGVYSTFVMTQAATSAGSTFNRIFTDGLAFTQTVIGNVDRSRSLSQAITYAQSVQVVRARFFSVSNVFFPHHVVTPVWTIHPFSTLVLTQALAIKRVMHRSVSNSLALSQVMNRNVVYNRAVASFLPLVQGRTATVNIQGSPGVKVITIPPVQITKVEKFVSYAVPGHILYLKPPAWGDSEGGLGKIIEHRTITGKVYTHVRRSPSRSLKYTFSVPRAKAEEMRQFVLGNLSTPMYMTNWKGEIWYGFITNNPFKLSPKRRSMPCSIEDYEVDVEFEGVRIH